MRVFFSSIFMEKRKLEEAKIYYPIKLEYYKIINEDDIMKQKRDKFGIDIVKTEYKKEKIKVENKKIQYLSNDEKKIEEVLNLLKENEVTPIAVEDVLSDFCKKIIITI